MRMPSGVLTKCKKMLFGDDFFTSNFYLFLLTVATVATWVTKILYIVIAVYAVSAVLVCLTQKTIVGLMPIIATFVMGYSVSQKEVMQDISQPIIAGSIFIAVLGVCLVVFYIKNRKEVTLGYFPKAPYILLIAATVLGGVGAGFLFTPQYFGGIAIAVICLLTLIALTSFTRQRIDKDFLARIIVMTVSIVVIETVAYYIMQHMAGNLENSIVNKSLDYGWNMSNGGGMIMVMGVPVLFYFATKRKFPIVEALAFVVLCYALLMTNSRGAQVAFLVILVPVIVYSFIKSKSKKGFFVAILCGIAVAVGVLLSMLLGNSDFIERWQNIGMSDSGRFGIYAACIKEILSGNFLFGWGFFHSIPGVTWNNYLAHNTLLQFWTNFGLLGLVTFVALCIGNYKVVLKKNGTWGVLMAMALLAPGIHGMLDVNYFTPYYMPILMVFIALASNVTEFRVKDEKAACLADIATCTAENSSTVRGTIDEVAETSVCLQENADCTKKVWLVRWKAFFAQLKTK